VASGLLTAMRNVGVAAGVAVATIATTVPAGTSSSTGDAEFSSGLTAAAWAIAAVSALGVVVALRSRDRSEVSSPAATA
jgi:hypothetical protein